MLCDKGDFRVSTAGRLGKGMLKEQLEQKGSPFSPKKASWKAREVKPSSTVAKDCH